MKQKIKIILVAGARPNFMKIAPLMRELRQHAEFAPVLVHTGQHYDQTMSETFFRQLDIPAPDINLEVGSASHAVQTARIMERFEKVCTDEKPEAVLVVGDVNSTAACVLVAAKLNIKTIHYEAGLRSFDRTMPEEINRLVTDSICDYFFTTSPDADEILIKEGKNRDSIFMCGNLMIDSLIGFREPAERTAPEMKLSNGKRLKPLERYGAGNYGLMTIHRPANVDNKTVLEELAGVWGTLSGMIPVLFPAHPRTLHSLETFGMRDGLARFPALHMSGPLGYLEFLNLMMNAKFIITDSGGIQEETTWLNIPCLTLRDNTERPVTVTEGSNKLVKVNQLVTEVELILNGTGKTGHAPEKWDGKSAVRIVNILKGLFI